MEARAALSALAARVRSIQRTPGEVVYNRTLTVRGPAALPLRFTQA